MKKKHLSILLIAFLAFFLRLYKIDKFPPGLYSDETTYGYNAYSLLTTGKDEYGSTWPLTFKSFGDYKPPMTAWLTIPTIAIFGLNELSVRLPSVLAGTFTVLIIYFLTQEIFGNSLRIGKLKIGELASFLLAISPWHLHFSRSSMLVGIEAMFISLGLLCFLKGLRHQAWLYVSALSFSAALYTYYGSRITVGLLGMGLIILFYRRLWKIKREVTGALLLGIIALTPLALSFINTPETLTGRARTISVFFDPGVRAKLWYSHSIDGENFPVLVSRLFHNKLYYYFRDISRRYLQHFSYNFLLRTGDTTPPFDIPNMGVLYLADLIFAIYGIILIVRHHPQKSVVLLGYLLIAPVVASFTFITPAANRSFNMIIPWTILTAYGITIFIKKYPRIIWGLTFCYICLFGFYLYQYYIRTPLDMPHKWHYGREELVQKISAVEDQYEKIVFSNREGPAYIWLLFYKRYDPDKFRQTVVVNEQLDELGWLHINSFDKYEFPRNFEWQTIEKHPNYLYVSYEDEIPTSAQTGDYTANIIDTIQYPN